MPEKRLPDLPVSENEFWQGEVILTEPKEKRCKHNFAVFDREIKCNRCGIGYYINVDDDIKDGHLYHNDKLIV